MAMYSKKTYFCFSDFPDKRMGVHFPSYLILRSKAFEKIVNLFNDGKKDELKSLLTKETYKIFSKAIDLNKNQPKTQILSITIESINKVWVEGKKYL